MPTGISMRMGALGVKGQVLDGSGPSGIGLNVKSDAMWVGTKSADTSELAPTEGDVTRVRLILQGSASSRPTTGRRSPRAPKWVCARMAAMRKPAPASRSAQDCATRSAQ